jgi:uncharacterized membrane protein YozB (DUF420 family)
MNWLVISIVLLVIAIAIIKFGELKHKLLLKVGIAVLLVFFVSLAYVYLNSSTNLTTYEGFVGLGKNYIAWLGGAFENIGSITGYVTKQSWGMNATSIGGRA